MTSTCTQCGYDTAGLPSTTCPECGDDLTAQKYPQVEGLLLEGVADIVGWVVGSVALVGSDVIVRSTYWRGTSPKERLHIVLAAIVLGILMSMPVLQIARSPRRQVVPGVLAIGFFLTILALSRFIAIELLFISIAIGAFLVVRCAMQDESPPRTNEERLRSAWLRLALVGFLVTGIVTYVLYLSV